MNVVLTTKYVKPTSKNHGHTNVFLGKDLLGYVMQNFSKHRAVGENCNFSSNKSSPLGKKLFHEEFLETGNVFAPSLQKMLDKIELKVKDNSTKIRMT